MSLIKILGTNGSRSDEGFTTCIQVNDHTLIDAGNIMHSLGADAVIKINAIFFTHSHLDHIIDSAFLLDNVLVHRNKPLTLYGLPETIAALKEHFFNDTIWPDFTKINLVGTHQPSLEYVEITYNQRYTTEDDIILIPIPSNHTVACCGYLIEQSGSSVLFSGDTYRNDALWELINTNKSIKSVILDVSFPNRLRKIAEESKHMTPRVLQEELQLLERKEVNLYINHIKPFYYAETLSELENIGISEENILQDGEAIELATGELKKLALPSHTQDERIHKLLKIGTALSSEEELDTLLEMIVTEAKALTNADGGTLYLVDDHHLRFKVVQNDSLGIKMGGTAGEMTWDPLPMYLEDGSLNMKMVAVMCALTAKIINIPDVYEAEGFSFEGTKKFDAGTGYRSKSMLVIPLKDHEQQIIGVLQLLNKQDSQTQETTEFDGEDAEITLSFASQAAIAVTNKTLIQGLENLLEAFLKSIIFAISKKSPYTAGHIRRMVKLSVMLAEAIDRDKTVYHDKSFSPEEIKQINFAALMHDIGKLATPEYVIDKATKLEMIFDRITLVEQRITIIKQALQIEFLKEKIAMVGDDAKERCDQLEKTMEEKFAILDANLEMIRNSNKGEEFTRDETVQKIQSIAKESWVIEGVSYTILEEEEAYNLSVQKGTLTNEERDIINLHAKISLDILNKLPFPKKYKEIPQISGNHHEKINGKGYPQGLKGDEISFEARILAIADIFEALTASDRPYKKANPISVAMKILYFMAKDGDLDREMVKFFFDSNLYMEYAKSSLPETSIDEVTVDFGDL